MFPDYCSRSHQSPINIEPSKAKHKDIADLTLSGYDTAAGHTFQLHNNGHTGSSLLHITFILPAGPRQTLLIDVI